MRITRTIASDCPQGWDCPRVYDTDEGRLVVQGYTVTSPDAVVSTVRITGVIASMARDAGVELPGARQTSTGDWLIDGTTVTDPDVLMDLHLPDGEHAVIPIPALQEALL